MSFQEKSAWVMLMGLLVSGAIYVAAVIFLSGDGHLIPPNIPFLVVYTIVLTVIAILGHILIAIIAPKEANAQTDERERRIIEKSGHLSGLIFGFGVVVSLMLYLTSYNGTQLFYAVFCSLILAQMLEYGMQIYFLRRTI